MRQVRSLYAGANTLFRKFSSCSQVVKIQVVESYCCNFDCGVMRNNFTKRSMYQLKVTYSASEMFVHNSIDHFECRLLVICVYFSPANTIINITRSNTWISSHYLWSKWHNILHHGA